MSIIKQTNRTMLFDEVNPEKPDLLTLVGDVRGIDSLSDEKIKEMNEALLVRSFDEFITKFDPVVYSFFNANNQKIMYVLQKPETIPEDMLTPIHLNRQNDFLKMLMSLVEAKRSQSIINVDFQFDKLTDMISPKKVMEDIKQNRKELQYTYKTYAELEDGDPHKLDLADKLNIMFEEASINYNNVLAMLPLAIEDIKTRLLLGEAEEQKDHTPLALGVLSMDEKGELKVLEAPKQETAELMVVDDNVNAGLIAALEDDYEALNEESSDYVKALVTRTYCPLASTMVSSIDSKTDIEDEEWQNIDWTREQQNKAETLKAESSYMVCTKGWGIIYFINDGQQVKEFANELDIFMETLQEQFGFDRRTVGALGELYRAIQEKYADKTQKEKDWYFTRALSQMAGYDNKKVFVVETHAWRRGAGQVYKYGKSDKYFVKELGMDEATYKYMYQMIRLQHAMSSDSEKYSYTSLEEMKNNNNQEFQEWKKNMEKGTGLKFTDDSYLKYYETLYNHMGKDKGDFSHMMYTIAANLIDKGNKVDNSWFNAGANETSWSNAEERKDITGWLGDAVYVGSEGKVSFGIDDYIADLDADNIANSMLDGTKFICAANDYYCNLKQEGENYRTEVFVENNAYDEIEKAIFDKISVKDVNGDGEKNYLDLEHNKKYGETYEFLSKLKLYDQNKK